MTYVEYLEKHPEKAFICHLPCGIEDAVFMRRGSQVYECRAKDFHLADETIDLDCLFTIGDDESWISVPNIPLNEFGKSLFLHRDEAEEGIKDAE